VFDEDFGKTFNLLECEQLIAMKKLVIAPEHFLRHAIRTAKVATVGDRDTQIAQWSAKFVGDVNK
jgi:hypothetical protein